MQGTEFTFANGKKATVNKVGIFVFREAELQIPKPQPPKQQTDLGEQENDAHPDYLAQFMDWQKRVAERRTEVLIQFGVEAEIDQEELGRFKAKAQRAKVVLPEDDLVTWVKLICCTTTDDFVRLQNMIVEVSVPTESKISQAADGFKSEVEGPAHSQSESSSVRGDG